jgi:hypothetical protein
MTAIAVMYGGMPDAIVAQVKHMPPLVDPLVDLAYECRDQRNSLTCSDSPLLQSRTGGSE